MNTDDNTQPSLNASQLSGREIIAILNSCTIDLSVGQTIQELQVAIERLTFGNENSHGDMSLYDIENLLGGDVSPNLIEFISWLHKHKLIGILIGQRGRFFLSFCVKYYRTVQEVRCITPIPLTEAFRIKLLKQLRIIYPEPARILFESSPTLIAGCIIDDGRTRNDMSLSNVLPQLVGGFVSTDWRQGSVAHGN